MRYAFIAIIIFISTSCKKKNTETATCRTTCYYHGVMATVSGFTKTEADTVYLRTYRSNGRFDLLEKEKQIVHPDTAVHYDTSNIDLGYLSADKDYIIAVPAASKTFSITMTIGEVFDTIPCNAHTCYIFSPGAHVAGGRTSLTVSAAEFYMRFMK